ncbi:unnamed protein product [Bursaphelenchus okinawaensis]|uniref:Helicase ATP-binding domain-containing protein n=1 Tax=Bursaphelenchus okinawaensis TaxID=465554 RepID=A0A811JSK2_9BILA|nr:unnamed protein product [Bursaphelenchus okinawaensis]CAG9081288.1 unnamed protein product [Bursaphelenchus okinawaensis]
MESADRDDNNLAESEVDTESDEPPPTSLSKIERSLGQINWYIREVKLELQNLHNTDDIQKTRTLALESISQSNRLLKCLDKRDRRVTRGRITKLKNMNFKHSTRLPTMVEADESPMEVSSDLEVDSSISGRHIDVLNGNTSVTGQKEVSEVVESLLNDVNKTSLEGGDNLSLNNNDGILKSSENQVQRQKEVEQSNDIEVNEAVLATETVEKQIDSEVIGNCIEITQKVNEDLENVVTTEKRLDKSLVGIAASKASEAQVENPSSNLLLSNDTQNTQVSPETLALFNTEPDEEMDFDDEEEFDSEESLYGDDSDEEEVAEETPSQKVAVTEVREGIKDLSVESQEKQVEERVLEPLNPMSLFGNSYHNSYGSLPSNSYQYLYSEPPAEEVVNQQEEEVIPPIQPIFTDHASLLQFLKKEDSGNNADQNNVKKEAEAIQKTSVVVKEEETELVNKDQDVGNEDVGRDEQMDIHEHTNADATNSETLQHEDTVEKSIEPKVEEASSSAEDNGKEAQAEHVAREAESVRPVDRTLSLRDLFDGESIVGKEIENDETDSDFNDQSETSRLLAQKDREFEVDDQYIDDDVIVVDDEPTGVKKELPELAQFFEEKKAPEVVTVSSDEDVNVEMSRKRKFDTESECSETRRAKKQKLNLEAVSNEEQEIQNRRRLAVRDGKVEGVQFVDDIYEAEAKGLPVVKLMCLDEYEGFRLEAPEHIRCKLRYHQAEALSFMYKMLINHIGDQKHQGVILGHCMGLGKTMVCISFLYMMTLHEKLKHHVKNVVIVSPLSVIHNWKEEFVKWLPKGQETFSVSLIESSDSKAKRHEKLRRWYKDDKPSVVIMGYDLFKGLQVDHLGYLSGNGPTFLICDEAHIAKNQNTQIFRALSQIKTNLKVAVTGTPMQNNFKEMFNLVELVRAGALGSFKAFEKLFEEPIKSGSCVDASIEAKKLRFERICILKERMRGVLHYRGMEFLEDQIPPKHEYAVYLTLSQTQIEYYQDS